MAEAIRAYMENPDFIKSYAPSTAKLIREAVNEDPMLKGIIQFNMGGSPVPAGLLAVSPRETE